jgi:phosphate transport system substrate-binding protein
MAKKDVTAGKAFMSLRVYFVLATSLSLAFSCGCGRRDQSGAPSPDKTVIRNEGSDTMVNIAQAWAEQYHQQHPKVSVQVLGGGSGVGIASLVQGNCDMANTSRKMNEHEIQRAKDKFGVDPKEIIVGYDALAIYVHKRNPLESISMDELADIFGENMEHEITRWAQLGVSKEALGTDTITRVSRQNSSGTYIYFRDVVVGRKKDLKLGSIDQSGSKDVVALVSKTPSAIGYSGMGYAIPEVKMLKVSKHRGEPGVAPTVENARNGSYPITRPLQIYVIGEPQGAVQTYLSWILSKDGQLVVLNLGYVPIADQEVSQALRLPHLLCFTEGTN